MLRILLTWTISFLLSNNATAMSFVVGNMSFDVLNEKEHTVSLTTCWMNNEVLQIPEYVEWKGQQYCVVAIGSYALKQCTSLKTLFIPKSCRMVNISAFNTCHQLISIKVEEENDAYCDVEGILFSKDMRTLYEYPRGKSSTKYVIPDGVENIGDNAFFRCESLQEIVLTPSLKYIGMAAFVGCHSMTTVTIPASVISIGKFAFYDCNNLKAVNVMGNLSIKSEDNVFSYHTYKEGKVFLHGLPNEKLIEQYNKIGFSVVVNVESQIN